MVPSYGAGLSEDNGMRASMKPTQSEQFEEELNVR